MILCLYEGHCQPTMRHVWPAQLPDDLVSTYNLCWRLDGIAVELQTMIIEQLYENHRQHLLELKMGSRLWRELASPVLHSSLHLPPTQREIDDLSSWENLLAVLPDLAHHVRYLKVDADALVANTTQIKWDRLLGMILGIFGTKGKLESLHLKFAFWSTSGINTVLLNFRTPARAPLTLILDFGMSGTAPTLTPSFGTIHHPIELQELGLESFWWKGLRMPKSDNQWRKAVLRARGIHLFDTPLARSLAACDVGDFVGKGSPACLTHLSIVDCEVTFEDVLGIVGQFRHTLTHLCFIGDDTPSEQLEHREQRLILPRLNTLSLEMFCSVDKDDPITQHLLDAHRSISTPALQHLGVGSSMVREDSGALVTALFLSRFIDSPNIVTIYCNHYEPEEGINGEEDDEESEVFWLTANRALLDQVLAEYGYTASLRFMMRCEYLDLFRGKEVEGFYPKEYEFDYA